MSAKLTKDEAIAIIAEIKRVSLFDDAKAHEEEDVLRYRFIRCFADGLYEKDEAIEIANLVLSTAEIEFGRWYE